MSGPYRSWGGGCFWEPQLGGWKGGFSFGSENWKWRSASQLRLLHCGYSPTQREPFHLSGLEPDGSLWAKSVLNAFGRLSRRPVSCLSQEPSDLSGLDADSLLSGLNPDSPPLLAVKSSFSVFSGRLTNIIHWAFIVYFAFRTQSSFFSLSSQSIQFKCLFQLHFNFNCIVGSLFDYYPLTVWLLFRILILKMYSRYFDPISK